MGKSSPFVVKSRLLSSKIIGFGALITLIFIVYTCSSSQFTLRLSDWSSIFAGRYRSSCIPGAWSDGYWAYDPKTNLTSISNTQDAIAMAGLQGCAADREFAWHLGTDHEEEWVRFPQVNAYRWTPSPECLIAPLDGAALLKHLVEQGGWLLLGDSITEQHFFSLSCVLYPHVRATPNFTENPYFDRAWTQNLYLSPSSPLLPTLRLPPGFSVEDTPLVTFRRVDLLLNTNDLDALYRRTFLPDAELDLANVTLFSNESTWSMSPSEYMPTFLGKPPEQSYGTLVVSTAGHWTTTLLHGFRDEAAGEEYGYGISELKEFFALAMREWAGQVQGAINEYKKHGGKRPKQVVVRAYLPGHENCHNIYEPWTDIQPFTFRWYNWPWIQDFNDVFNDILASPDFSDVFFLPIERPGRLRPDAHASGDCLHMLTGPGVIEGWSHYIWHFVTHEIGGRIR